MAEAAPDSLLASAIVLHPEDAASVLRGYAVEEVASLIEDLGDGASTERLTAIARLVTCLLPSQQARLLERLSPGLMCRVLLEHRGAETRLIVSQLGASARQALLDACSERDRPQLARIFSVQSGTVEGIMGTAYIRVRAEEQVESVRARIRAEVHDMEMPIYCVGDEGQLQGAISPLALIASDAQGRAGALVQPVLAIGHLTPVDLLRRPEVWGELHALPVVDRENRLLGVVHRSIVQPGDQYAGATLGESLLDLLGDYVKVSSALAEMTLGRKS